ncbi:hypothetical protein K1719_013169 [Acacia pycnantha]|nr:hypothetical protein K1719_013169 [Acacia pycnantha]
MLSRFAREEVDMEKNNVEGQRQEKMTPLMDLQMRIPTLNLNEINKRTEKLMNVSPRSNLQVPKSSSDTKKNCLCSPTTHAGSFRCRHHRADGFRRVGSVGSSLSDLTSDS